MKVYRAVQKDTDEFWLGRNLLSKDADIFMPLSIRNLGKSYVGRKLCMRWVKEGHNCIWTRWSASELKKAASAIIDDDDLVSRYNPAGEWKKVKMESDNSWYYEHIPSKGRLYFFAIKASNSNKGLEIPDIKWWVYDEFIPESYDNRTRRLEEADKFFSMYQTLVRTTKGMRVLMCANCISWFNGYTDAWNIKPFPAGEIRIFEQKLVIDDSEFVMKVAVENIKVTKAMAVRVAKNEAVRGNRLPEGYFDNMTSDNFSFIAKCPDMTIPLHSIEWVFRGKSYSFRRCGDLIYWTEVKPRKNSRKFTTNKADVTADVVRDKTFGDIFDKWYDKGLMRFSDGNVEQVIISMIWASHHVAMALN